MSKVIIPALIAGALPADRFAQNDDVPSQTSLRRVSWAYNHAATRQKKVLFMQSYATQSTPAPTGTSVANITFVCRTGESCSGIGFFVGLAPASATVGSSKASVALTLLDADTTFHTSADKYYPRVSSGTYAPSEVAWVWGQIDSVSPNSLYKGFLTQKNYCRVHSIVVYELSSVSSDTSTTGISDPLRWEATKPIYDDGIQDLAETGTKLWQHNGAQLLSWSRHTVATAPVVNSTTYANILGSGSTYSASQPGFHINTQYHNTQNGTVPVEFGAMIRRTSGTGDLDIKLEQSGGTLFSTTLSGSSGTPFSLATGTIEAASAAKTDILARCSDGSTIYEIDAIGLWEYEA